MSASSQPPHEDELQKLDWEAIRESSRRRLRPRLGGFSTTELDDAVGAACERMVKFVRRRGLPDSPEGLLVRIVRAVAADFIAQRQRDRALIRGDVATWLGEWEPRPDEDDVLEEYRQIAFHVREYFKLRRAGCLPIADAKARGETLKEHAARNHDSYEQVRQAWSRCVRLIHEAMRMNRLRLAWPTPRKREAS